MAFEMKNLTGSLFKNDNKQTEVQPDFTGHAVIDRRKVKIAAWGKTTKDGRRFLSLSFKLADEQQQPAFKPSQKSLSSDFF